MARIVPGDLVDASREGRLVHSAVSSGREVRLVPYIEGLRGSIDPRYAHETTIVCRTADQAAEIARVLREAPWPPLSNTNAPPGAGEG